MNSHPDTALVAYVPSPHRGYLEFFRAHKRSILYLFGQSFIDEFSSLTRNLPGDAPEEVQTMVTALGIFAEVRILTKGNIAELSQFANIVMPDEDVAHKVAGTYLSGVPVVFDGSWRLRWHWDASVKKERPVDETTVSSAAFDRKIMQKAYAAAEMSSDWWRQAGAVLVKDGEPVLAAYNRHQPSEQTPYLYGDPRSNFEAGKNIEVSSALHAEIGLLTEAARRGMATEGADLYVTTFPCPPCAYACANSGIKRLFYTEGYSLVEGSNALRARGVELIRIESEDAK